MFTAAGDMVNSLSSVRSRRTPVKLLVIETRKTATAASSTTATAKVRR